MYHKTYDETIHIKQQNPTKKSWAELFNECRILLHSPLFWDLALEGIRKNFPLEPISTYGKVWKLNRIILPPNKTNIDKQHLKHEKHGDCENPRKSQWQWTDFTTLKAWYHLGIPLKEVETLPHVDQFLQALRAIFQANNFGLQKTLSISILLH